MRDSSAAKHTLTVRCISILVKGPPKEVGQRSGPLVRGKKSNDNLPLVATLFTSQAFTDFSNRKIIAKVGAKLNQTQPRVVAALSAIRAVVVRVVHVSKAGSLELGVIHEATLSPSPCGSLVYNSYSGGEGQTLYAGKITWQDPSRTESEGMLCQCCPAPRYKEGTHRATRCR